MAGLRQIMTAYPIPGARSVDSELTLRGEIVFGFLYAIAYVDLKQNLDVTNDGVHLTQNMEYYTVTNYGVIGFCYVSKQHRANLEFSSLMRFKEKILTLQFKNNFFYIRYM